MTNPEIELFCFFIEHFYNIYEKSNNACLTKMHVPAPFAINAIIFTYICLFLLVRYLRNIDLCQKLQIKTGCLSSKMRSLYVRLAKRTRNEFKLSTGTKY